MSVLLEWGCGCFVLLAIAGGVLLLGFLAAAPSNDEKMEP